MKDIRYSRVVSYKGYKKHGVQRCWKCWKSWKTGFFENYSGKAGKNTNFSHATPGKAGNLLLVNIICINQNHTIILIFQLL